jgi:hypothetical protein
MLLVNTYSRARQNQTLNLTRCKSLRAHLTREEGLARPGWAGAHDDGRVAREEIQVPTLTKGPGADHLVYKGVQTLSSGGSLILY